MRRNREHTFARPVEQTTYTPPNLPTARPQLTTASAPPATVNLRSMEREEITVASPQPNSRAVEVSDSLPVREREIRRQEWLKTLAPGETARMPEQGSPAWQYIMSGKELPTGGNLVPLNSRPTGGNLILLPTGGDLTPLPSGNSTSIEILPAEPRIWPTYRRSHRPRHNRNLSPLLTSGQIKGW